jgi:hypothetical protein
MTPYLNALKMSNVDLILTYLSGDLSEPDASAFEKELSSNPLLKKEFEEVSSAYGLVRDQIRKRDQEAFRAKLQEVMERGGSPQGRRMLKRRNWWYFMLPLAGSLALLLVLLLAERDQDYIVSRYFHPEEDLVILAFNQSTRGGAEMGIVLFREGRYSECMDEMSRLMEEDSANHLAMLYYMLSSMETGNYENALRKYASFTVETDHQVGQSILWYSSLAMVKTGRTEEASGQLRILEKSPGPYQSDAVRLQKMLLK